MNTGSRVAGRADGAPPATRATTLGKCHACGGEVPKRLLTSATKSGRVYETVLVAYARNSGAPHSERRIAGAAKDRGDIAGSPGVVLEVKAPGKGQPIDLAGWWDETVIERANDNAEIGILVIKRRNRGSPGDWYWVTDGKTMTRLLREAGWWVA